VLYKSEQRSILQEARLGPTTHAQQAVIDYLSRRPCPPRRARPSTALPHRDQRHRLAAKGKALGRRGLADIAGIVTPDTIVRATARRYYALAARAPSRTSRRCGPNGDREVDVGLHTDPRRLNSFDHDVTGNAIKSDPQRPRYRARNELIDQGRRSLQSRPAAPKNAGDRRVCGIVSTRNRARTLGFHFSV
jgi:hypothetical protein